VRTSASYSAAVPATVSGVFFVDYATGIIFPGKATKVTASQETCRQRGHARACRPGCADRCLTKDHVIFGESPIAVTCHLACHPRCSRVSNHQSHTSWRLLRFSFYGHWKRCHHQRRSFLHACTCSRRASRSPASHSFINRVTKPAAYASDNRSQPNYDPNAGE
jgi:hypothetical protein